MPMAQRKKNVTDRLEGIMSKYDDIINLPHPVSKVRTHMSIENRAAQFAPFAALSGHDDAIAEVSRMTTPKHILSEDEMKELSFLLTDIITRIPERNTYTFMYFVPDKNKEGGKYVTLTGCIRKYDEYSKTIIMTDGNAISIENILSVKGNN